MANPTSAFGWQMPTSTDLVTDLPADFETFGQAVDTSLADLKGGTTGQVLSKASGTDMDFAWVNNSGPAFSAYMSAAQSLTSGTLTKLAFNTENYDTDSCYSTANYRFTPTKAGYYQVNATIIISGTATTRAFTRLFKNGSYFQTFWDYLSPTSVTCFMSGSTTLYMNGTTDYIEIYGWAAGTSNTAGSASEAQQSTSFNAVWIRS